ncbi:MAG: PLP-dependent transferase [Opitutaceae bacterium]|nr:PLP-dependent transferase [Opitutaceae bacterium]
MSVFHHLPLGRRIPDRLHAVSVSLPTMRDLIGYEEKVPATVGRIVSGYPRFVLHPCLRQLTQDLARRHGLTGRTLWLTASARSAAELAAHLAGTPPGRGAQITIFAGDPPSGSEPAGLHGVNHPENSELYTEAKAFLQNTGMFLGSREAEDTLVRRGRLAAGEPEALFAGDALAEIKRVLRRALPAAGDADLFPACSGMNAIYAAFRAVSELQAARGRTIWVQLGWLYRDTISILKRFVPDPVRDYVHLPDVFDQAALERLFAEKGDRIAGIFAEAPTNPLIQTPDVPALAALARRHGVKLVLDPSIASLFCVDVLAHADVVVNSLTKFAACEGDVMAGLVAVNPTAPDAGVLRRGIARKLEPVYPRDLARLAAEIGGYETFMSELNGATPKVAAFLESHPKVKKVYWPLSAESQANYLRIACAPDAVGGMLSFTLKTPLAPFYDAVRLPKGPSFGMKNSLLSPFIYIAHYDLVKTAAGRAELAASGIDPDLLRLSVGAEPVEDLIAALAEALER